MLHICVSEPVQIMVCRLFGAKPLSIPMLLLSTGPLGTNLSKFLIKIQNCWITKLYLKILSAKLQPYCPEGDELTEPMLTYHQWDSVVLTQDHFHKKCSRYHFIKVWKTTFVEFFSHIWVQWAKDGQTHHFDHHLCLHTTPVVLLSLVMGNTTTTGVLLNVGAIIVMT